jgi:hypothetical protein
MWCDNLIALPFPNLTLLNWSQFLLLEPFLHMEGAFFLNFRALKEGYLNGAASPKYGNKMVLCLERKQLEGKSQ